MWICSIELEPSLPGNCYESVQRIEQLRQEGQRRAGGAVLPAMEIGRSGFHPARKRSQIPPSKCEPTVQLKAVMKQDKRNQPSEDKAFDAPGQSVGKAQSVYPRQRGASVPNSQTAVRLRQGALQGLEEEPDPGG